MVYWPYRNSARSCNIGLDRFCAHIWAILRGVPDVCACGFATHAAQEQTAHRRQQRNGNLGAGGYSITMTGSRRSRKKSMENESETSLWLLSSTEVQRPFGLYNRRDCTHITRALLANSASLHPCAIMLFLCLSITPFSAVVEALRCQETGSPETSSS